jgi:rhamnopyranosyl-N-acetylglucosaminyl-diphospho-decaprenol beta-1,3/1,4-galactofuranosyltransferase
MNIKTVCAVVVTYNRKELLIECLNSLKNQNKPLNAIYIIDNASNDGTSQLLWKKGFLNEIPNSNLEEPSEKESVINLTDKNELKIYYCKMLKNLGGTGGFYEGIKKAFNKNYDWIWIMDDDSEPKLDALEKLYKYFDYENVSALANLVYDLDGQIQSYHNANLDFNDYISFVSVIKDSKFKENKVLEIDMASFVGLLINSECIEKISFPKKELFIYEDDIEYSIRLKTCGKILLITNSIIIHKAKHKKMEIKRVLGRNYYKIPIKDYWRIYFGLRNYVWLRKDYMTNRKKLYSNIFISYSKLIIGIILVDDNKLKRLEILTNAYIDGLKANFDNNKPFKNSKWKK